MRMKVINSESEFGLVKNGDMIPAVNQAAATMLANSERALSWAGFKFLIEFIITFIAFKCQWLRKKINPAPGFGPAGKPAISNYVI